jgi:hypothetical protein
MGKLILHIQNRGIQKFYIHSPKVTAGNDLELTKAWFLGAAFWIFLTMKARTQMFMPNRYQAFFTENSASLGLESHALCILQADVLNSKV